MACVLAFAAFSCAVPTAAMSWTGTLIPDSVASWWARPNSVYQPAHGITYVSGVSAAGDWIWGAYDEKTGITTRQVLGRQRADDHNTPAILAPPNRPPVVFYTGHNRTNVVWYRVSGMVGDWYPGEERAIAMPGPVTYVQAHVGRTPDTILLFTRCIDDWLVCVTEDYGKTWRIRPLLRFEAGAYGYLITARLDDGTIRGAVAGHPDKTDLDEISYFEIDPYGEVHGGPGTAGSNIYTGEGLPVSAPDRLTLAYRYPEGRRARLFDVSAAPEPEIVIAQWAGDAEAEYVYLRNEPTGWSSTTLARAGRPIGYRYPIRYLGGATFPNPTAGGLLYMVREASGEWRLERWTGGMDDWAPELITASRHTLARPSVPLGASPLLPLLWLNLTRYDDYENFEGSTDALFTGDPPAREATGTPIAGDWDGDGRTDPGVFSGGNWTVRVNGETARFRFGRPGDIPVAGDWDGDGSDEPGVFRSGTWILASNASAPAEYRRFAFGQTGDRPIAGDWDGDSVDGIGVRRAAKWFLRQQPTGGRSQISFDYGRRSDTPFAGDWDGDGVDGIGVRRDASWLLRPSASGGPAARTFAFGRSTDAPVVGVWTQDGTDTVAVRRASSGIWYAVVAPGGKPAAGWAPDRLRF